MYLDHNSGPATAKSWPEKSNFCKLEGGEVLI